MKLTDWLRRARRALPDIVRPRTATTTDRQEPGLASGATEQAAAEAGREEVSSAPPPVEPAEEVVRGERGIPSVNRERSIHARVTHALAIGVMVVLGVGFLSWYYATTFNRRADEEQRVKDTAASRATGEMKLPPLAPIEPPNPRGDARAVPPDSLAAHVLGPAPDLPRQAPGRRAVQGSEAAASLQPVGFTQPAMPAVQQPSPPSPEEVVTLRRLSSPVLYRSAAVGSLPLVGGATPALPMPVAEGQFDGSTPMQVSAGPSSNGGGGSSSLGGLLQATPTLAVQAQVLPTRRLLLPKGAFIDCTLETALDSQLPGMTTCITATDIFGADGQVVLLERGSKLVGETRGELRLGQGRVFVLWTEARTPTGVVVQLASPGTDELGRSGLSGYVDTHFWQRFGAAILISVIDGALQTAVASQRSGSSGSAVVYNTQGARDVMTEVLRSTVNIPPTVVKNQGERIQVFVARDLDFRTVYTLHSRAAQ